MNYDLRSKGDRLYAVSSFVLEDEPILREFWFYLNRGPGGVALDRGVRSVSGGFECTAISGAALFTPYSGSKKASIIVEIDLPEPKTRLPVRWVHGKWEKKTNRGWITI